MKACKICARLLPENSFHINRGSNRSTRCGDCKRLSRYGLNFQEHSWILDKNLCQICFVNLATDIDHDHSTGRVRGVLCNSCNVGLARFKDNENIMSSAIEYLRERA